MLGGYLNDELSRMDSVTNHHIVSAVCTTILGEGSLAHPRGMYFNGKEGGVYRADLILCR